MPISFLINSRLVTVQADPATPLVQVLRDELGLTGTKQGCDLEGECGACTVLLDGQPIRSCITPVGKVSGRSVLTVEGLGSPDQLHPLQQAFIDAGAVQCGFCTPGMLLASKALLDRQPDPTDAEILQALDGHLCRCTGYTSILRAVHLAATYMQNAVGSLGGETAMPETLRSMPSQGPLRNLTPDPSPLRRGEIEEWHSSSRGGRRSPKQSGGEKGEGDRSAADLATTLMLCSAPRDKTGDDRRVDSADKVTGRARFVEDIMMPGMLYASVLRSPHHHARLVALDIARAARKPGVARVLTAVDIPGLNGFPSYSQEEPVLTKVGQTVRMVGAPVALVVAETQEIARAALGDIDATYEALPHTFDVDEALRPGAYPIAGSHNVLSDYQVRHGDVETALARSAVVVQARYTTAYLAHGALERESLLGYVDEQDRITVVGGNHEPHHQQGYIAKVLGLTTTSIRVIQPPTGGSFGGKQDPWPFTAMGLMVYHLRRPIRMVYSRRESLDATPKRHPYDIHVRVGATADGKLTGIWENIVANTGAYDSGGQFIPNFAVTASGGPYSWQAADITARTVYTNGAKAGQFRGFGTAQAVFATECALDELAEQLGVDPLKFRMENRLREGEISFLGYPVGDSLGFDAVLSALRPTYDAYQEQAREFNAQSSGESRRGVGVAGMWYRFGKSGSLCVEAHAELAADGRWVVYCSAPDYGQGTNTVMSQIAAEALGVPRETVTLVNADTARVPDSGISGASRSTFFVGGAVTQAAANLKDEILGVAAELLDMPPSQLILDGSRVAVVGTGDRAVSLVDLAREFDRIGKPRRVMGVFDLSDRFSYEGRPEYIPLFVTGAHVSQVQVNLRTGEVSVLQMAAAHDVGHAVNPTDARGQIEGAIVMGLGAALMEEYIPGETTGFHNYYLPTCRSMPQIKVELVQVPSRHGHKGAKGLAESPMLPSTPAIVNAISRAIGARVRSIPATPERVLAVIREQAGR